VTSVMGVSGWAGVDPLSIPRSPCRYQSLKPQSPRFSGIWRPVCPREGNAIHQVKSLTAFAVLNHLYLKKMCV